MRIIGGRHRGRRIEAPKGQDVRPTSDRTREAVFNILAHGLSWRGLEGASVLDVFAGTGALGLEALSRGAAHATFIEASPAALKCIQRNAAALGEWRAVTLLRLDACRLPPPPRTAAAPVDLAFLDPPYGAGLGGAALLGLHHWGWLGPGAVAIVEAAADEPFQAPHGFVLEDERTWGRTRTFLLAYRPEAA